MFINPCFQPLTHIHTVVSVTLTFDILKSRTDLMGRENIVLDRSVPVEKIIWGLADLAEKLENLGLTSLIQCISK